MKINVASVMCCTMVRRDGHERDPELIERLFINKKKLREKNILTTGVIS